MMHDWSAYDICESWAIKRGFYTAKAARPDVYRAANHLLRMALDGRTLCLAFLPPNYMSERAKWDKHSDVKFIESLQGEKPIDDEMYEKFGDVVKEETNTSESENESESAEEVQYVSKSRFDILQECE